MTTTDDVLAHLRAAHGLDLTWVEDLAGGFQSGARRVVDHSGTPYVLKWSDSPGWADVVTLNAPLVAEARAWGWPTPAWVVSGSTPTGDAYELQEWATGATRESIDRDWVDAVLPVVRTQAGHAPSTDRNWSWYDHAVMFAGESAYVADVEASGPDGAALGAAVRSLVAPFAEHVPPTRDLVHGDLNPGNVLLDAGRVTALVDVEALGPGTRCHDLGTIATYAWLWGDPDAGLLAVAEARTFAGPGELEISFGSALLGLLAYGVQHWAADDLAAICRDALALTGSVGAL